MGDRRVRKTQESIQAALVALLGGKPYDKITVTELCARADVSRITFYAHYADKDALIEEMFQRLAAVALADFGRLQGENNPAATRCRATATCSRASWTCLRATGPSCGRCPSGATPAPARRLLQPGVRAGARACGARAQPADPALGSAPLSAFLCSGLWAYIDACYAQRVPLARIREETQALLTGILQSDVFIRTA